MGKRSNFVRHKGDFYRTTDPRAVAALLPHIEEHCDVCEPCAGAGDLARQLDRAGYACVALYDIEPAVPYRESAIEQRDALTLTLADLRGADCIITNPPWTREILHPLIEHLSSLAPTWLLFDADWVQTKQSAPYMRLCTDIVAVGRLRWMQGTKHDGKDNSAWYRFCAADAPAATRFHGRAAKPVAEEIEVAA